MTDHDHQVPPSSPQTAAAAGRHIPGVLSRPASEPYRCSPTFTAETLPAALQREHRTKRGVWGVIRIFEGALRYCKEDGSEPEMLDLGSPGLIRPEEAHHVEVVGPFQMRIEFFDHDPTAES